MSKKPNPRAVVKDRTTTAYEKDRNNRISLGHPGIPPPPAPKPTAPQTDKK